MFKHDRSNRVYGEKVKPTHVVSVIVRLNMHLDQMLWNKDGDERELSEQVGWEAHTRLRSAMEPSFARHCCQPHSARRGALSIDSLYTAASASSSSDTTSAGSDEAAEDARDGLLFHWDPLGLVPCRVLPSQSLSVSVPSEPTFKVSRSKVSDMAGVEGASVMGKNEWGEWGELGLK